MDDTLLLFSLKDQVKKFPKYVNSHHKNMKLTYQSDINNCLAILDVLVTLENTFCMY